MDEVLQYVCNFRGPLTRNLTMSIRTRSSYIIWELVLPQINSVITLESFGQAEAQRKEIPNHGALEGLLIFPCEAK